MRTGIVLPHTVAEVALTTPLLRAMAHQFPATSLLGILSPTAAEVLEGTQWLHEQILYDPQSTDPRRQYGAVLRRLRQHRLDQLVVLPAAWSETWLAWRSRARQRIGYAGRGRGWLLTHRLTLPPQAQSTVDGYLALAARLGCAGGDRRLELNTTFGDERQAEALWQKHRLTENGVVALCPSSENPSRAWPADRFAQLAKRLATSYGCQVLVVCLPDQRETARQIAAQAGERRVVSLADEAASIGLIKACLRRARLVVATDCGARHLAAALGIPTVALFGSTDPRHNVNYNPAEIRLHEDVPCGPCERPVCHQQRHACMEDLSVTRVFGAVQMLWDVKLQRRAA